MKAALAVAQAILGNTPTVSHSSQSSKAAKLESIDGSREKKTTEKFIQVVHIMVTMQIDTFADERMKVLYTLSFSHGGMAQIWAMNETMRFCLACH